MQDCKCDYRLSVHAITDYHISPQAICQRPSSTYPGGVADRAVTCAVAGVASAAVDTAALVIVKRAMGGGEQARHRADPVARNVPRDVLHKVLHSQATRQKDL